MKSMMENQPRDRTILECTWVLYAAMPHSTLRAWRHT